MPATVQPVGLGPPNAMQSAEAAVRNQGPDQSVWYHWSNSFDLLLVVSAIGALKPNASPVLVPGLRCELPLSYTTLRNTISESDHPECDPQPLNRNDDRVGSFVGSDSGKARPPIFGGLTMA